MFAAVLRPADGEGDGALQDWLTLVMSYMSLVDVDDGGT